MFNAVVWYSSSSSSSSSCVLITNRRVKKKKLNKKKKNEFSPVVGFASAKNYLHMMWRIRIFSRISSLSRSAIYPHRSQDRVESSASSGIVQHTFEAFSSLFVSNKKINVRLFVLVRLTAELIYYKTRKKGQWTLERNDGRGDARFFIDFSLFLCFFFCFFFIRRACCCCRWCFRGALDDVRKTLDLGCLEIFNVWVDKC